MSKYVQDFLSKQEIGKQMIRTVVKIGVKN